MREPCFNTRPRFRGDAFVLFEVLVFCLSSSSAQAGAILRAWWNRRSGAQLPIRTLIGTASEITQCFHSFV